MFILLVGQSVLLALHKSLETKDTLVRGVGLRLAAINILMTGWVRDSSLSLTGSKLTVLLSCVSGPLLVPSPLLRLRIVHRWGPRPRRVELRLPLPPPYVPRASSRSHLRPHSYAVRPTLINSDTLHC